MSDDEEYYDDDDEWYWYEEDYMGIGDDLAATAVHSPIMVEDPSLEVVETFSDWDYYSDDYYDDDPSIMKQKNTASGSAEDRPRKKKRKLTTTREEKVPPLSLGPAAIGDDDETQSTYTDPNSFKGVVWRTPPALTEDITLYEPGKGEKVALLSDWREVFKTSLIHTDWFKQNPASGEQRGPEGDDGKHLEHGFVREITPESTEFENRYATYSPPPLEIDDLSKSISRQREKSSISDLKKPQSNLREMMVVGDSEGEEPDEVEESAAPVEDDRDEDMEIENQQQQPQPQQQKQEQQTEPTRKKVLRVEVPAPSRTLSPPPPRKRGRKPKDSSLENANKQETVTSTNKPSNPRKREASTLQPDEHDEPASKRRSRRIASASETQSEQQKAPAKSTRGRKKKL